jgi:hypothetical protein
VNNPPTQFQTNALTSGSLIAAALSGKEGLLTLVRGSAQYGRGTLGVQLCPTVLDNCNMVIALNFIVNANSTVESGVPMRLSGHVHARIVNCGASLPVIVSGTLVATGVVATPPPQAQ